ncbi:MAG TPA: cysteine-rich CWC family protein [Pyrinomonadaceae bacterium]|nr:cysteine-rich CWC family protein [Pyrinomonadaceae bacterium]
MDDGSSAGAVLVEGEDYYLENGLMVFTARYHLRRGYCCESDCRHCPYKAEEMTEPAIPKSDEGEGKATDGCAACGLPFACGVSLAGCWCAEIKLTDATRQVLREKFNGCLCRSCLEKLQTDNSRVGP